MVVENQETSNNVDEEAKAIVDSVSGELNGATNLAYNKGNTLIMNKRRGRPRKNQAGGDIILSKKVEFGKITENYVGYVLIHGCKEYARSWYEVNERRARELL